MNAAVLFLLLTMVLLTLERLKAKESIRQQSS